MITLTPAFANVAEFVHMGGHGPYVWAAWAISLVCAIGLASFARQSRKRSYVSVQQQRAKQPQQANAPITHEN